MMFGIVIMDDLILVSIGAFLVAVLTVPAGFGLSTMLTPLVLLLMGPHEAVAVVAIVHGAHNGGKYLALKKYVNFDACRKYGIWLVFGSIIGALLQNQVPETPLLAIIGIFLIILPLLTMSERWMGYKIPEANDRIGGFSSGFMGGLSGHQGALRAMFLSRRLPDKMAYAATASILALCVDLSRIPVYLIYRNEEILQQLTLTCILIISALLGVNIGKLWLKNLKVEWIQRGVMLGIIGSGFFYLYEAIII
ncbi:MAG: hypothetical protein CMB56_006240 [Methanobacteriota archaeon]|nr:MAG: hypothetical protein CMB56_006240 [Euryarchaeota archaeon]|tara:strand:+ start:21342 stop:22094 length:753 start_codon:yes stop_codon:yes gene_type:complete